MTSALVPLMWDVAAWIEGQYPCPLLVPIINMDNTVAEGFAHYSTADEGTQGTCAVLPNLTGTTKVETHWIR